MFAFLFSVPILTFTLTRVFELEPQLVDDISVPLRQLDDGVDQHGLPGGGVGQEVGVGAGGPVE